MSGAPGYPPKYVMLDNNQNLRPPPQHRRNLPRYHEPHSKSSSGHSCIKCICCCYCCLFFLIFILTIITYVVYTFYKPQVPSYNVSKFEVTSFNVSGDFSVNAEVRVIVKADNPNGQIGFIYGKDSAVAVLYAGKTLCAGKLPAFEQGTKNVTMMKVNLKGKNEFGSGLQDSLMEDAKAGKVPLVVTVKAPITVVIGDWPLRQLLVRLNCSLTVDSLMTGKQTRILSTKYSYQIMF